jgi:hypothetical protein
MLSTKTRQLRKIKIDARGNVEIKFQERVIIAPENSAEDSKERSLNYIVEGNHAPHEDLTTAMTKLRKYALDICEFPDDPKTRNQFSVISCVISGDMDMQNSRVMFSIGKYVKSRNKVVNIATPQTMMYGDEYAKADEMTKQIENVINEVWLYLDGKNADKVQMSFTFEKQAA